MKAQERQFQLQAELLHTDFLLNVHVKGKTIEQVSAQVDL